MFGLGIIEYITGILSALYDLFIGNLVNIPLLDPIIDFLLGIPIINFIVAMLLWKPLFAVIIFPGLITLILVLLFAIWLERKIAARIQWRVGPHEISRHTGGIIQALADGIRYFFQEFIIHKNAHRQYFTQLPVIAFILVLLPLLFIPMGPQGAIVGIETPYAIPIIIALISLIPITIIGIGWASNSKFAYIGSIREAFMYIAYEIPLILLIISVLIMYGSADPYVIVERQGIWGALMNPIAVLGIFIITAMSSGKAPFEIAEADSEIAFGPFTEYSGIMLGVVMTLAYEKVYLLSLLMALLFFGGWSGPYIGFLGDLSPAIWLFLKAMVIMSAFLFLRSVYARYRLDQTLKIGWTFMLELSLVSLIIGVAINLVA
jgi:NADH-quinone oxidoreductase subunit H